VGNLTPSERPAKPRPLCETMPRAVAAAIGCGNGLSDIRLEKWAETYRCGVEDIRRAWEAELSRISRQPINSYDVEGK
jgi:hypothetical protein